MPVKPFRSNKPQPPASRHTYYDRAGLSNGLYGL